MGLYIILKDLCRISSDFYLFLTKYSVKRPVLLLYRFDKYLRRTLDSGANEYR